MVCESSPSDDDWEKYAACHWLEEDVEGAVENRSYRTSVKGQVWDREPCWERDEGWTVRCLHKVSVFPFQ